MATSCYIGLDNLDGTVSSIYVHFDGYDEHTGEILRTHYANHELVQKLISLGDLSVIAPSTDCPTGHSFETPIQGYCIAYNRDRGESWSTNKPIVYTMDEWKTKFIYSQRPYKQHIYTFTEYAWHTKQSFEER